MKHASTRREVTTAGRKPAGSNARQRPRLTAPVGREIDDIYFQLDCELTRMAEFQVLFDRLRSKIRLL